MDDKALELKFNGELYVAGRENTMLFTFFGALATFNHVYLLPVQGEGQVVGGYVWNDHNTYQPIVDFIQAYNLPQILNSNKVSKGDRDAYKEAHPSGLWLPGDRIDLPKAGYKDLEDLYFTDSFPEDWDENKPL